MSSYEQKIQDAIVEVGSKDETSSPLIVLSTGVVLEPKKFSMMRIQAIMSRFKLPEIPLMEDADKGRPIRNPNHPLYIEQKNQMEQDRSMAIIDAIIAFGTKIKFIPEDFSRPEDDDWIEELKLIEIPVNETFALARYQAWVKFVAAPDLEDISKISEQFNVQMGTSEVKIAANIRENFPS